MTSPFRKHQQTVRAFTAGQAAQAGIPQPPAEGTDAGQEYAVLKVRLDECLRKLADVASHEARLPMKADYLAAFAPWVDGIVAADQPVQDEILLTCMVWACDIGDHARALQLGAFAVRHGLAMPERYKRSVACFLREDIAQAELDQPGTVALDTLAWLDALTVAADMPDPAKAKLNKALGRAWMAKADAFDPSDDDAPAGAPAAYVDQAAQQFDRALALDAKAGVKKDIDRVKSAQRKLAAASEAAGGDAAAKKTEQDAGSDTDAGGENTEQAGGTDPAG